MKRVYLAIGGMGLFAVGGCVTAEVLADAGMIVDLANLILGGLGTML